MSIMTKYNKDGSLNTERLWDSTNLTIHVRTEHENKGTKVTVKREAKICSRELTFKAMDKFNKDLSKINRLLRAAIKENRLTTMWVGCSNYGLNNQHGTKDFTDCWEYKGWAGEDNACAIECSEPPGFNLSPDLRHTQFQRAMFYDFTLESLYGVMEPEDSEKEKRHKPGWRQENMEWQQRIGGLGQANVSPART